MVDPTAWANVRLPQQNIAGSFLGGLAAGQKMRQRGHEMRMRQEAFDIKKADIADQKAKEQAIANAGKMVLDSYRTGNMKDMQQGLREYAALDVDGATEMQNYLGNLDKTNLSGAGLNVYAAAASPDPETQVKLLRTALERERANPNSPLLGQIQKAMDAEPGEERMAEMAGLVKTYQALGGIPGEGEGKSQEELAEIRAKTGKLEAETMQILSDIKNADREGELSADKKFDYEQKLSDKYYSRTKNYQDVKASYDTLLTSAEADSGPGDLALITSFMKMLDPGSVVRETEFANAQDTAGLYNRIKNMVTKWKSGERLAPEDRERFVSLSRQYMEAADKREQTVRNQIGQTVRNYGLNAENIFPEKAATEKPERRQPEATQDYNQMSSGDILQNLMKSMGQ